MTRHSMESPLPVLPNSAVAIIEKVLPTSQRILLYGPPGSGKSTLATALAQCLTSRQQRCTCISADPGSPVFGVPGGISLAEWQTDGWQNLQLAALCTLDAGRFRLPLVSAVRKLAITQADGVLLIDGPGVVRGVAGRELLTGLVEAASIDTVLILTTAKNHIPLADELHSLGVELYMIPAAVEAIRPGKRVRARRRTQLWDNYLQNSKAHEIPLTNLNLRGIPPPREEAVAWIGRQVALQRSQDTLAMGEIVNLFDDVLTIKIPVDRIDADSLLIRDAGRNEYGLLETAEPFSATRLEFLPPSESFPSIAESGGPRIVGRVGVLDVTLVNGVFGDPLLHLRIRHKGRSLLFDLGEGSRLSARLAHQVSDVFISHAHMDHIAGFQWLMRSRLGEFPLCRLYGPPGLAKHINGFIQSILWDRIGDRGPRFEVNELHGRVLRRFQLQAGHENTEQVEETTVSNGIVLKEPGFQIRAIQLDHHTPVLAYAFEPDMEIHIRKDRLAAHELEPGPWLTVLKQAIQSEKTNQLIDLPDGTQASTGALQQDLTLISPGKKLVYATDFADTPENRERLIGFAKNAHTFFCEAAFLKADADHAERNAHLTTRACGEIAADARVSRLVAFHFSRRYATRPDDIYEELKSACDRTVIPQSMMVFNLDNSSETAKIVNSELKI